MNASGPEDLLDGKRQCGWEERHVEIQLRESWKASGEPGSQSNDSLGFPGGLSVTP